MVKFNKEQLQAINFYKGACAVIAGAGSGKSTVLLNRIKNLIEVHNEKEPNILAITFTRNTADELKKELTKMDYLNVNVGTFHSICGKILIQEGISLSGNLIKEWQAENCFKAIDKKADVKDIISFISYQKNYLRTHTDEFVPKDSKYDESELRTYFKAYEETKKKQGLFDFDDYLIMTLELLRNNPNKYTFEFVLVDEHQDSNLVQNLILKEICQSGNIFCLFDYRQAIYSFRAGNVEYCMNFEKYWNDPVIINLHTNYRSTNNIVTKANKFIKKYYGTYEYYKDSEAHNPSDGKIEINTYIDREVEGIEVVDRIEELIKNGEKLNNISVLYRLNSHSSYVENELKKRDIEYDIVNDSSFFKRKEVAGIIAYLRLINNPHDDSAFDTIFKLRNYPITFFSGKLYDEIKKYSGMNNLSLYEAFITMKYPNQWQQKNSNEFKDILTKLILQKDKDVSVVTLISNITKSFQLESYIYDNYTNDEEIEERINSIEVLKSFVKGNNLEQFITYVYSNTNKKKVKKDAVRLMSVHASKGLEFKNVFLVGIEDDKFPHQKANINEEARLYYVAVTRAKENLYISEIGKDNQFIMEYK